jgi:hypothetical protein
MTIHETDGALDYQFPSEQKPPEEIITPGLLIMQAREDFVSFAEVEGTVVPADIVITYIARFRKHVTRKYDPFQARDSYNCVAGESMEQMNLLLHELGKPAIDTHPRTVEQTIELQRRRSHISDTIHEEPRRDMPTAVADIFHAFLAQHATLEVPPPKTVPFFFGSTPSSSD